MVSRRADGSGAVRRCYDFSIPDLRFALAWAAEAPGLGGWRLSVIETGEGERVEVTPPGAETPVFGILNRGGHVEVVRMRPLDSGGGQVMQTRAPTLPHALLLLCALDPAQMARVEAAIGTESVFPV